MASFLSRNRKLAAGLAALALVAGGVATTSAAYADSAPTDPTNPTTPATVTADALPAPQIDGVAWAQVMIGNTVYVGGSFWHARPAGAAAGTKQVLRTGLLSYDITTGVLNPGFAPLPNGAVQSLAVAPDGKHLYVGGTFTKIGSKAANRIAEIDATTGAVVTSFRATANGSVKAIAVRGAYLYLGGLFTAVDGAARTQLARVTSSTGSITAWAPKLAGGAVSTILVSPGGTRVVIGGNFTSVNGSSKPGYGLAGLVGSTGALVPWAANDVVRDGGSDAGVTSLVSTGDSIVGTGYSYHTGGNVEGAFRTDWNGNLIWLDDCHGDSYDTFVQGAVVYIAGHTHSCATLGSFSETTPTTHHRAVAVTLATTQTLTANKNSGYANFAGTPAPSMLDWFPDLAPGTATGLGQAAWSVTGTTQYLSYAGEFPTVNGVAQQGIVRFAVAPTATNGVVNPNRVGPISSGAGFLPTLSPDAAGIVRVTWQANADPDNQTLSYSVYRNGNMTTPVLTMDADSLLWSRPTLEFTDTGLTPGSTYSYRVRATDPAGNTVLGDNVSVTVPMPGGGPSAVPTATLSPVTPSNPSAGN